MLGPHKAAHVFKIHRAGQSLYSGIFSLSSMVITIPKHCDYQFGCSIKHGHNMLLFRVADIQC